MMQKVQEDIMPQDGLYNSQTPVNLGWLGEPINLEGLFLFQFPTRIKVKLGIAHSPCNEHTEQKDVVRAQAEHHQAEYEFDEEQPFDDQVY